MLYIGSKIGFEVFSYYEFFYKYKNKGRYWLLVIDSWNNLLIIG